MSSKPFYTAVRGVLIANNKVLMLKRAATSKSQGGFWEFPGGKVDQGERLETSLIREFKEETGLDIELESVFDCGQWEREEYKIAYLFFLVRKVLGEVAISREHDDFAWMDKDQLRISQVTPQLEMLRDKVVQQLS